MFTSSQEHSAASKQPREPPAEVIELAHRLHRQIYRLNLLACAAGILRRAISFLSNLITGELQTKTHLDIEYLAEGGYNDVWLVRPRNLPTEHAKPFILRIPSDDSLKPNQMQNEVGWLTWMRTHCPEIPVPKVYAWSDGSSTDETYPFPFLAEEYIEGDMLCDIWMTYRSEEKETVAGKIAELIVHMGELRFDKIAGISPTGKPAPTVEGHKLFKGRDRFHRRECYDIGPYSSTEQYVLAQYDKEIYYHLHADATMFDGDFFGHISPGEYAGVLRSKREEARLQLEKQPLTREPFVLCHGDLQGRNILMRGTEIAAIIDWEFAGSYPLSELNQQDVEVVEWDGEDDEDVATRETQILFWGKRIQPELQPRIARERGWREEEIEMLMSRGREVVGCARVEMVPDDPEVGDGKGKEADEEENRPSPGASKVAGASGYTVGEGSRK